MHFIVAILEFHTGMLLTECHFLLHDNNTCSDIYVYAVFQWQQSVCSSKWLGVPPDGTYVSAYSSDPWNQCSHDPTYTSVVPESKSNVQVSVSLWDNNRK